MTILQDSRTAYRIAQALHATAHQLKTCEPEMLRQPVAAADMEALLAEHFGDYLALLEGERRFAEACRRHII